MRLPTGFAKRRSLSQKRSGRNCNPSRLPYESLEDRRLLATIVSYDSATSGLIVEMTESNDSAVINITNGNVSVNGSEDVDPLAPGTQSVVYTAVRKITVTGDSNETNQVISLAGDYSTANGARLQSALIQDVHQALIPGNYDFVTMLDISLSGSGGQISDLGIGRLSVGSTTQLLAGDNRISLTNPANDFVGAVEVDNGGADRFVILNDANDIQFDDVTSGSDFVVTAVGSITNVAGATIDVDGHSRLTGANITIGGAVDDSVSIGPVHITTTGNAEIHAESAVILGNVQADNLTIRTLQGIFDGRTTLVNVEMVATFEGGTRIRLGDNGSDTFNAGSLNINSNGYVSIWEDSSTDFTGNNFASSLGVISLGDITDDANAQLNVVNNASFEAENVVLGDETTDQFNAGSINFFASGDVSINENSGIHIIETKNRSERLFLRSTSTITDANDSQISVERIVHLEGASVNIGDTENDSFNAGSVRFITSGQTRFSEDSDTNLIGTNEALSASIESAGAITNVYSSDEGDGTEIVVTSTTSFTAATISLGNEVNDLMSFGSLHLSTPGTATVAEDNATHLTLDTVANQLNLTAAGAITNALTASINVNGLANLNGTSIALGQNSDDEFNAMSVTINSAGNVRITEDSGLNLEGISRAAAMTLVANGTLTDSLAADTQVTNLFNVSGTLINLGSEVTDVLVSALLRFNSTGNTNITSDGDVLVSGQSFAGDRLILTSAGDINDTTGAETRAQNRADLTGVNIILGVSDSSCFDIIDGGESNLVVNASGVEDVDVGC